MANIANCEMVVCGRKEAVRDFIVWLKYRSVSVEDIFDEGESKEEVSKHVYFSCKWSIESATCITKQDYEDAVRNGENYPVDYIPGSLHEIIKELGLSVEAYSEEGGCCFMEHYLFIDGKEFINNVHEYHEYWLDDYTDRVMEEESENDRSISPEEIISRAKKIAKNKTGFEFSDYEWGEGYAERHIYSFDDYATREDAEKEYNLSITDEEWEKKKAVRSESPIEFDISEE